MKKQLLPLGIQTFSKIRQENKLYVDKTKEIFNLITSGNVYFMSRPRRFGKSLLVSTLGEIFSGNKKLFDGLYIKEKTDWKWEKYPVIKLAFTAVALHNKDDYEQYIIEKSNYYAEKYDIVLTLDAFERRFAELVRKLSEKHHQVVLLIDEYDKPILKHITHPKTLKEVKSVMNDFYGSVKELDQYLKFVFITGVSKFSKVSVFSGMNNLTDISMDDEYSTICGITQTELEENFIPFIDEAAKKHNISKEKILTKIKKWYNGYFMSKNATAVYNPFSTLHFFNRYDFSNYWFTSATPTFLIDLLKKNKYDLSQTNDLVVSESSFAAIEPENMVPESLFFQTGYLTIKNFDGRLYHTDFPNYEVKSSFLESIIDQYGKIGAGRVIPRILQMQEDLENNNLKKFFETMKIFFANIPYDIQIDQEAYYQSMFYSIIELLGFEIEAEVRTNIGRIDTVIKTDTHIYIIEFKLDDSAQNALKQITDKKYAEKFDNDSRKKVLVGVAFTKKERNIGEWVIEKIQ